MGVPSVRGPFRPETGATPPYLGGREREQALFRELLTDLTHGTAPGTQVVLYGPRGNGKTALLRWLRNEASASGVETLVLVPSEIPDQTRLTELATPDRWWRTLVPGKLSAGGLSWAGTSGRDRRPLLKDMLASRARKAPLLVVADEAHTLDLAVGRALLNAAQEVGAELPCLVVLAGTPNLEGRLSAMGASFWNRAEQIRIGRLDEAATAEALARPLSEEGVPADGDALAVMVRESQRYPYFVQLVGRAVWASVAGRDGERRRVTTENVRDALPEFGRTRDRFYRQRLDELRKGGLLPAARAVAEAFRERAALTDAGLEAGLATALGEAANAGTMDAATEALAHLGFLWRADDRLEWEPGIPSLMDFTREVTTAS